MPFFLHFGGGFEDGARLHLGDFGIDDAEAAAAEAEHRVELVQFVHALRDLSRRGCPASRRGRSARRAVVRQEFVQRRVEETDGGREALQRLEDADEVVASGKAAAWPAPCCRSFHGVGENHLAHRVDAVAFEEHVLGAAEADADGAEGDGVGGLLGRVGVGADLQPGGLGAPVHQLA